MNSAATPRAETNIDMQVMYDVGPSSAPKNTFKIGLDYQYLEETNSATRQRTTRALPRRKRRWCA